MRLISLLIVIFGALVSFYPSIDSSAGKVAFALDCQELAEPAPKPEKTRSDFATLMLYNVFPSLDGRGLRGG